MPVPDRPARPAAVAAPGEVAGGKGAGALPPAAAGVGTRGDRPIMLDLRRRGRPLATGLENGASRTQYWERTSPLGAANHRYLVPGVLRALRLTGGRRVLDIGWERHAHRRISAAGFTVTGIDFEPNGIEQARQAHPEVEFLLHDLCDPLPADLQGRFDVVLSAEVIEHLFLPRELFARAGQALDGEGRVVVTTPYHGYAKNLALAITGRFTTTGWPRATTATSSSSPSAPWASWPGSAASNPSTGRGSVGSRRWPPPW